VGVPVSCASSRSSSKISLSARPVCSPLTSFTPPVLVETLVSTSRLICAALMFTGSPSFLSSGTKVALGLPFRMPLPDASL